MEAEMSEKRLKRKTEHEEIQDLVSKKKKMELDIDIPLQFTLVSFLRIEALGTSLYSC